MRLLARIPSASNADAFVHCGASHLLPQHDKHSEYASAGTEMHDVLAAAINGRAGGMAALKKALPHYDLSCLLEGVENPRGEAAFVVNVKKRTSTFLGKEIGRDYAGRLGRDLEAYEFGVSLDVDGTRKDSPHNDGPGISWCRDFKFGKHSTEWQIRIQAMALAWSTGATKVFPGILYINIEDGGAAPIEDAQTMYAYELDDHADALVRAWDRVMDMSQVVQSDLQTTEGPWCAYCGALPHCPSKWKLAKAMLDDPSLPKGSVEAMTVQQCGQLWARWKEIAKMGKERIEEPLKLRMNNEGGFPLPNGKIVRQVAVAGRRTLDFERARDLLAEKGATVDEIESLYVVGNGYTTTKETKR